MSEQERKAGTDTPGEHGTDWILQDLVLLADEGGEMPVALFLHGMVVSGYIVSGQRYLELINEQMNSEKEEELPALFRDYSEVMKNNDREGEGPHFIHLRNATFMMGNAINPAAGHLLWRGKISDIVGHALFISLSHP